MKKQGSGGLPALFAGAAVAGVLAWGLLWRAAAKAAAETHAKPLEGSDYSDAKRMPGLFGQKFRALPVSEPGSPPPMM
jgi:hypothetical protein